VIEYVYANAEEIQGVRRRSMKKGISTVIYIKNVVIWVIITCFCVIAMVVFAREFFKDLSAGREIFLPGVVVLVGAVLCLLVFSVTRVKKYIKYLRQG
jgi:FtsH-binding integral membrane protein